MKVFIYIQKKLGIPTAVLWGITVTLLSWISVNFWNTFSFKADKDRDKETRVIMTNGFNLIHAKDSVSAIKSAVFELKLDNVINQQVQQSNDTKELVKSFNNLSIIIGRNYKNIDINGLYSGLRK